MPVDHSACARERLELLAQVNNLRRLREADAAAIAHSSIRLMFYNKIVNSGSEASHSWNRNWTLCKATTTDCEGSGMTRYIIEAEEGTGDAAVENKHG